MSLTIYCAGPLFNPAEKEEMASIARALEEGGYDVFLPQRDGLEYASLFETFLSMGYDRAEYEKVLNRAVFYLDIYHVLNCDGLVLNMNGRVPDEGAMVEAGAAWASNKPVCIYKNDARTLLCGADNPMILGLANFRQISSFEQLPLFFDDIFASHSPMANGQHPTADKARDLGRNIALLLNQSLPQTALCEQLANLISPRESAKVES